MIGLRELPYVLCSYTASHHKLSSEELFDEMSSKLDMKEPFVGGKIGGFELWAMRVSEFGYKGEEDSVYDKICNNAGFFSDSFNINSNLKMYSERMKNALANVDYLIRWQYPKEEYFIRKYCSRDVKDIDWFGVTYRGIPIGRILEGRKVLVVTPFAESVEKQYARRELIYSKEYLPEFELHTYRAVQTIAGNRDSRFKNWFEALDSMASDIKNVDFDIALIGCGAYSLPLCSEIKKIGKSAIHMGGDVQLLFGIMGKRWEEDEFVQSMKNEFWIYPEKNDIPHNSQMVEDGCYW